MRSRAGTRFIELLVALAVAAVLCGVLQVPAYSSDSGACRIVLYTYGPARLQVMDPANLRSGEDLETGKTLEEIPGSRIVTEKAGDRAPGLTINLLDPAPGTYRLTFKGTGKGRFVLDMDAEGCSGELKNTHVVRRISKGEELRFALKFSDQPGGTNGLEEVVD